MTILILPALALLMAPWLPRWGFMWTMACALYASGKWLTYRRVSAGVPTNRPLALGYLLAWPGMNAKAFLFRGDRSGQPRGSEWRAAILKTLAGVTLTWIVARTAMPNHPLLAGWLGMVGLILTLHFGTFHLLSLGWRRRGVDASPVMRKPMASSSLSEFWGRRWNTAFHELATQFTYHPAQPIVGRTAAMLLVFLVSGLIHEMVISVPAHGGYGLPTGYFVLQGLGVAAERTRAGRRLGLGSGWRGWLFTALFTAGPAYWLFPPPFVRNIILPTLAAVGAI
jgi:hypothetical protein